MGAILQLMRHVGGAATPLLASTGTGIRTPAITRAALRCSGPPRPGSGGKLCRRKEYNQKREGSRPSGGVSLKHILIGAPLTVASN